MKAWTLGAQHGGGAYQTAAGNRIFSPSCLGTQNWGVERVVYRGVLRSWGEALLNRPHTQEGPSSPFRKKEELPWDSGLLMQEQHPEPGSRACA